MLYYDCEYLVWYFHVCVLQCQCVVCSVTHILYSMYYMITVSGCHSIVLVGPVDPL
jgi:hypothetical protein